MVLYMENFWIQANLAGFLWTGEMGGDLSCVALSDFIGFLWNWKWLRGLDLNKCREGFILAG